MPEVSQTCNLGDVFELVTFVRTAEGQNQSNRTHWQVQQIAGVSITIPEAVSKFSDDFSTLLIPLIPTTHTYLGAKMRRLVGQAAGKTQFVSSITGQGVGTQIGDPLPSQVCGLISRRASGAPPRHRGRFYVPSTTEVYNSSNGDPTAAYLTDLADLNLYLRSDVTQVVGANSATFRPKLVQFNAQGQVVDYWTVDSCLSRSRWATQRRRGEINRPDVMPF